MATELTLDVLCSALSGAPHAGDAHVSACTRGQAAAVMVIICGRQRPRIIMTVRPPYLSRHAGEISFPGGKVEAGDSDLLHTALRETEEEIGLRLERDLVIGKLDDVVTRNSGFVIAPFVAVLDDVPVLRPSSEVEEILEIPLDVLLDSMESEICAGLDASEGGCSAETTYTFGYGDSRGRKVWGASAQILAQIRGILDV